MRQLHRPFWWHHQESICFHKSKVIPILESWEYHTINLRGPCTRYFVKKKKIWDPIVKTGWLSEEATDNPAELLKKQLFVDQDGIAELVARINPLRQFDMLRELTQPGLFGKMRQKKLKRKSVKQALVAASNLIQMDSTHQAKNSKTVYLSEKDDELPIVIDTGASVSVTPNINDFQGPIRPCELTKLKGLNSSANVVGVGNVKWMIRDVFGCTREIVTVAYYVPNASIGLFSSQTYFKEKMQGELHVNAHRSQLTLHDGSRVEFPFSHNGNLPIMLTTKHFNKTQHFAGLSIEDAQMLGNLGGLLSVADENNQNVTAPQRELLLWHQRLGHTAMQRCQTLLRVPPKSMGHRQIILPKHKSSTSCPIPKCAACQLGKQHRHGTGNAHRVNPERGRVNAQLKPGDMVSMDQYISGLHGRLPHTKGKEAKSKKYTGGTLFVDHASGLIYHQNQVSLRSGESIKGKNEFERFSLQNGVRIKAYRADNHPFNSVEFRQDFENKNQAISFSGVGAHHQNGVAERSIQTVTSWA